MIRSSLAALFLLLTPVVTAMNPTELLGKALEEGSAASALRGPISRAPSRMSAARQKWHREREVRLAAGRAAQRQLALRELQQLPHGEEWAFARGRRPPASSNILVQEAKSHPVEVARAAEIEAALNSGRKSARHAEQDGTYEVPGLTVMRLKRDQHPSGRSESASYRLVYQPRRTRERPSSGEHAQSGAGGSSSRVHVANNVRLTRPKPFSTAPLDLNQGVEFPPASSHLPDLNQPLEETH